MSMSSHPAENGPTLLDLWKAQARIENSRARENWDKLNPEEAWEIIGDAEIIHKPEIKPDSEKKNSAQTARCSNQSLGRSRNEHQRNLRPNRDG